MDFGEALKLMNQGKVVSQVPSGIKWRLKRTVIYLGDECIDTQWEFESRSVQTWKYTELSPNDICGEWEDLSKTDAVTNNNPLSYEQQQEVVIQLGK